MCQVQILSVNGVIPPGSTNPTHLRVAGRLSQCPSGQVVVTSNITAPSPPTSPTFGAFGDGFIVVLPITAQNVVCGDVNNPITVDAECFQRPACKAPTFNGPLECCEVTISSFDAIVVPGSLTPSQIRVTGTSQGCTSSPFLLNDPVIVRVSFSNAAFAQSGPISVDALTGSFSVQLPIPAATPVQCDDRISVDAWCSNNPNCKAPTVTNLLDCPQCARAEVRAVSAGPCVGTPPMQPIRLEATINIARGAKRYFRWSYGDGTISPVFEIDNSAGSATTPYPVPPYPPAVPPNPAPTPTHDYSPGLYSAELIVTDDQGNPLECDKIPLTVVASCNQCPTVTASATPPGPCVNGKRKVTLLTQVISLPPATAFQWLFGDGQQGLGNPAALGAWPTSPNPAVNEHDYAPGTYTATLVNILSPSCPPVPVTVVVDPCPNVCCPQVTLDAPQVTGCAPGSAVATFNARLNWMAGCTPVAPMLFAWTLNVPGGNRYQKRTNLPSTDTTSGWEDPGGNPTVVQFVAGNPNDPDPSVSVIAVIPGVTFPCNPTDTISFPVAACCPQLIGPLNASQKLGDPCTWLFSARVSNPNNAAITFEWSFQDGTTDTTSVPQTEHTYTPGAITTGMTTVTLKSPNCPDQSLSATVTQICRCPTIATPSAVVTGCAPGTAAVTLSTSVTPPIASFFDWTVTTPAGTSFTKTTTTASTTDGVTDGAWIDTSTGSAGPLNLGAPGTYAVMVRARGPALSPTCPSPAPNSFTIPTCTTPPPAPGIGCIILLILALLFLLAGAVVMFVAGCMSQTPMPQVVFVLWIVGAVLAIVGLILLFIWGLLCGRLMCRVLNALAWIFSFLAAASAILAVVLLFIGNPCGLGSAADAIEWGLALAVVGWLSAITGCRIFTLPI